MQLNEDAIFYKFPKFITNYDEGNKYYSISWLGYQLEFV
jgi:hypothetical protein